MRAATAGAAIRGPSLRGAMRARLARVSRSRASGTRSEPTNTWISNNPPGPRDSALDKCTNAHNKRRGSPSQREMALLLGGLMTHSQISKPNRSLRFLSRGRRAALLASILATGGVMAASAAVASSGATLTVHDTGGKAAELLHRLTIPQLASVLKTTPGQLTLQAEAPNLQVGLELGETLTNPTATLQEVLNLLAAHGVSTAPLEAFINHQLAGVSATA